jgi:hypothetical protein
MEMNESAQRLVSHMSGKRMMAEGANGTLRGQLKEGVTIGNDMLHYIPWNLLALNRTNKLKPWMTSWIGDDVEY